MVELIRRGRVDQVARSVQRGTSHLDHSLIATRCSNCTKGGQCQAIKKKLTPTSNIKMITIMLDRPGIRARGPTSPPSTSPTITVRTTAIHASRHISTTRVTLHLRPKQSHILQKLQTHGFVKEQACKEHRVWSSIFRQHRTSKWQPRGEGCSPQSCFVFRYDPLYTFHHYVRFWAKRKLAQRRHSCNGWRSLATEDVCTMGM